MCMSRATPHSATDGRDRLDLSAVRLVVGLHPLRLVM